MYVTRCKHNCFCFLLSQLIIIKNCQFHGNDMRERTSHDKSVLKTIPEFPITYVRLSVVLNCSHYIFYVLHGKLERGGCLLLVVNGYVTPFLSTFPKYVIIIVFRKSSSIMCLYLYLRQLQTVRRNQCRI